MIYQLTSEAFDPAMVEGLFKGNPNRDQLLADLAKNWPEDRDDTELMLFEQKMHELAPGASYEESRARVEIGVELGISPEEVAAMGRETLLTFLRQLREDIEDRHTALLQWEDVLNAAQEEGKLAAVEGEN